MVNLRRFWPQRLILTVAILLIISLSVLVSLTLWADYVITNVASPFLFNKLEDLPVNRVGLVLGTSRYTTDGEKNQHYYRRLDAVTELLRAGKIKYILASGDRTSRYYDEPTRMRKDLIKIGVPKNLIYRDYAGFRTLDSVLRAQNIFGLSQLTIISQGYHNERALFIAHNNGINAIAWNAKGTIPHNDYSSRIRELLARLLAFFEVTILEREPVFQDKHVVIGTTPPN